MSLSDAQEPGAIVAEVRVGGESLLGHTLRAVPDAVFETQYQATAEAYTFAVEGDFEAVEAALRDDTTVGDPKVIADLGERRVYQVCLTVDREIISEVAADHGIQILSARGENGAWTMRMRARDRSALTELKAFCDERGIDFRVGRVYTADATGSASPLTGPQREFLETAYREGFFDEPRGASLADLAEVLDISSSAASGRLRRAMRSVVEASVVDGADEDR